MDECTQHTYVYIYISFFIYIYICPTTATLIYPWAGDPLDNPQTTGQCADHTVEFTQTLISPLTVSHLVPSRAFLSHSPRLEESWYLGVNLRENRVLSGNEPVSVRQWSGADALSSVWFLCFSKSVRPTAPETHAPSEHLPISRGWRLVRTAELNLNEREGLCPPSWLQQVHYLKKDKNVALAIFHTCYTSEWQDWMSQKHQMTLFFLPHVIPSVGT